jgi:ribulose kinase
MPKSESQRPYLAFDFGAESGRAGQAHFHSGVLTTEEIHRFQNEPVKYGVHFIEMYPGLWFEVRKALASVERLELAGIGVDALRLLDLDVSPEELERRRR